MSWDHIVVHHSASHDTSNLDVEGIERYHTENRGWRDIGYHRVIEMVNGRARSIAGRPLSWAGSHEPRANRSGIGVCFVGNYSIDTLPLSVLEVGAQEVAGMLILMGIKHEEVPERIRPHRYYKSTECPGTHFPFKDLVERVQEIVRTKEV